jgi:ribonuclease D
MTLLPARFIQDSQDLPPVITSLMEAQFIALDTEFVRRNTYKPILCLVQAMTDQGDIFLLDALSLDLSSFWQCLQQTSAIKVFHDSRQDLEIVWLESDSLPSPIFDTQLAALLLGLGESCGFARLVEVELGISLTKDQTETDWSQRPLSDAQLQYAIDDVLYLAKLYPQLIQKLNNNGRLTWIDEDNQQLSETSLYQADMVTLRKKVKPPPFFNIEQKLRLDNLLLWRESKAIEFNKPRQWILDNGQLLSLAEKMPKQLEQLSQLGLTPQTIRKHGLAIIELINHPPAITPAPITPSVDAEQLKTLRSHIEQLATELGLRQSAILANKDELSFWLATGHIPARLTKGWRRALLNESKTNLFVEQLRQATQP